MTNRKQSRKVDKIAGRCHARRDNPAGRLLFQTQQEAATAQTGATKAMEPKQGPNRGNAGKGRPKGSPNKITSDLKRAILEAAEAAGAEGGTVGYLTTQATANPASFLALLGKVLPMQVTGEGGGPLVMQVLTGVPRSED